MFVSDNFSWKENLLTKVSVQLICQFSVEHEICDVQKVSDPTNYTVCLMNKLLLWIFAILYYFPSVLKSIGTRISLILCQIQTHSKENFKSCYNFPVVGFILNRFPRTYPVFSAALPPFSRFSCK